MVVMSGEQDSLDGYSEVAAEQERGKRIEKFKRAANAAKRDDTFMAVTALCGADLGDHSTINANVTVSALKIHLDDDQIEALGVDDADESSRSPDGEDEDFSGARSESSDDLDVIVGYNTEGSFTLKTAKQIDND